MESPADEGSGYEDEDGERYPGGRKKEKEKDRDKDKKKVIKREGERKRDTQGEREK